jgi:hypothetical protein
MWAVSLAFISAVISWANTALARSAFRALRRTPDAGEYRGDRRDGRKLDLPDAC